MRFLYRSIILYYHVVSAMIRLFGSFCLQHTILLVASFFFFSSPFLCTYVYLCFLVQFDDDNSIWLYCHVVINDIINVTPTHKIFKIRLNVFRWWSQPDDDDVMAEAEYSPENKNKVKIDDEYLFIRSYGIRKFGAKKCGDRLNWHKYTK